MERTASQIETDISDIVDVTMQTDEFYTGPCDIGLYTRVMVDNLMFDVSKYYSRYGEPFVYSVGYSTVETEGETLIVPGFRRTKPLPRNQRDYVLARI